MSMWLEEFDVDETLAKFRSQVFGNQRVFENLRVDVADEELKLRKL